MSLPSIGNISSTVAWRSLVLLLLLTSFLGLMPAEASIRVDQHAGGAFGGLVQDDQGRLHVAQGPRIHSFRQDAGGQLELLGSTAPLEGWVVDLAVEGSRLFAALSGVGQTSEHSIVSFSIGGDGSLQTNALFRSSDNPFSQPWALALRESKLFVLDEALGLLIFGISDQHEPTLIGQSSQARLWGETGIRFIDQERILVWGANNVGEMVVRAFNVSDPTQPVAGPARHYVGAAAPIVVDPDTVVVAAGDVELFSLNGLELQPRSVLPDTQAFEIASRPGFLMVLRATTNPAIEAWSIEDILAPTLLGESAFDAFDRRLLDDRIYALGDTQELIHLVANSSLRWIDFEAPESPIELQRLAMPGVADVTTTLEIDGRLYLLDFRAGVVRANPALAQLDRTVLSWLDDELPFAMALDMVQDAGLLLVADHSRGVHVMRVEQEAPPTPLSLVPVEAVQAVAMDGNRAWALKSSPPQLISIDLSQAELPVESHFTALSDGRELAYAEGMLFVRDSAQGILAYRVDEHVAPAFCFSLSECTVTTGLSVQDNMVAVGCESSGVFLYRLAGDTTPELLGHWPGRENPALLETIALDGPRLWVKDSLGLLLIDLEVLSQPVLVDELRLPVPGKATLRRAAAGGVWLASSFMGVWRVSDSRILQPGQSAAWFNPERAGEGWQIEILDAERAVGYWFTFDEQGNQRWLLGVGEVNGLQVAFPELIAGTGPAFGPNYDSEDLVLKVVGTAWFEFSDCDHAQFGFDACDQQMELSSVRLSRTMLLDCNPRDDAVSDRRAMQTGSWFPPTRNGQGFTLQWLDDARALMTWFTYDALGRPFWIQAVGQQEDAEIVFPDAFSTRGPQFGEAFSAAALELVPWGEIRLSLECNSGQISYRSVLPEFGEASYELQRLSIPAGLECP